MRTAGFGYITRAIRAHPSFGECLVRTVLAIVIPTLMRWFIDRGAYGAPFVLYFPAIQMIATYLGWRWGAATAVGSGIAGWAVFLPPPFSFALTLGDALVLALFAISAATMVFIGELLRNSVLELGEQARQSDDFNRELQHRTKNSLQMMRALASQASKATDPGEFYEMLAGRLGSLAKANELLRFGALKSCRFRELVDAAVAPFPIHQFDTSGPDWSVSRNACTPLMMALHELGTNASKYGALSVAEGKVAITWQPGEEEGEYRLTWKEIGGPPVAEPTRRGMGTRLLRPSGGVRLVDLRFPPDGVVCEMVVAGA
jgi:two-component sensor histidine kinase